MKILNESIQDIESYLQKDVVDELINEFGKDFYNKGLEVLDRVLSNVNLMFGETLSEESVSIYQVVGDEVSLVDQSHIVIVYNGYYYDYLAQEYDDLFKMTVSNIPVVQRVMKNMNQISERVSTIKSYAMVGSV